MTGFVVAVLDLLQCMAVTFVLVWLKCLDSECVWVAPMFLEW